MSSIAKKFGIPEALEALGVKDINKGTSTGSNWFSSGEMIESRSPVDDALIGKVSTTTPEDYEKVIETATAAPTFLPIRVDPVADIKGTRLSLVISSPTL